MRRKVFQNDLADSLALADVVLFGPVNRAQLLADDQRLSPEMICQSIESRGGKAAALSSAAAIAEELAAKAKSGDLILIMSNGGFDGLTGKLLENLKARAGARA
jgi:UDP-N-acetylmuramate: L-alanyl-gamma-D-glutamyl-meso-diaminopimelate ligase